MGVAGMNYKNVNIATDDSPLYRSWLKQHVTMNAVKAALRIQALFFDELDVARPGALSEVAATEFYFIDLFKTTLEKYHGY